MAGMSAHLTLKEARAMQERIQHSGSQAKIGSSKSSSGGNCEVMKKQKHQG